MPTTLPSTTPQLRPGMTVRLHLAVQEGEKVRVQLTEGLIIAIHRGRSPTDHSVTLRSTIEGIVVERIVPLASPLLRRVDVIREAKVRRAKLTFLRRTTGKSSRMKERFSAVLADIKEEKTKAAEH